MTTTLADRSCPFRNLLARIYILLAVRLAQPGLNWRAFFSPIAQTLRQTPYITRLHPWIKWRVGPSDITADSDGIQEGPGRTH
jgi:hypothetical protein